LHYQFDQISNCQTRSFQDRLFPILFHAVLTLNQRINQVQALKPSTSVLEKTMFCSSRNGCRPAMAVPGSCRHTSHRVDASQQAHLLWLLAHQTVPKVEQALTILGVPYKYISRQAVVHDGICARLVYAVFGNER
jgi:hypothetical protein